MNTCTLKRKPVGAQAAKSVTQPAAQPAHPVVTPSKPMPAPKPAMAMAEAESGDWTSF